MIWSGSPEPGRCAQMRAAITGGASSLTGTVSVEEVQDAVENQLMDIQARCGTALYHDTAVQAHEASDQP